MFKELKINDKSRVLLVYPHPDDETYSNACLINRLVKANISLKVVCLTKGAKSTLQFGVDGGSLADVREQEFKNVMNYLNVEDYEIWDLEDGELEITQNLEQLVHDLINNYKPTHVGTFEPCGIYGHPDHIHLSKVITNLKNQHNFTLIYATVGNNFKPSTDT
ncbi:MAG: PIG-L family deacetylase [Patescibacteria group bacterium]